MRPLTCSHTAHSDVVGPNSPGRIRAGTWLAVGVIVQATVEYRGASGDLLHQVVREGLPGFLDSLEASGRFLPYFVHRELERFVRCGDPADGFAWLTCNDCDVHRLIPFSCKGRAFCPSCGGRRMADRAAHWVDRVFPRVGVRQWVLTVPWQRRFLLARDPALVRGLHAIAIAEILAWYRDEVARRGHGGQAGSVSVIQRFGSALRLNVHFHILVTDGCFAENDDGEVRFHRAYQVSTEGVERLVSRIAASCERWLASRGHGPDDEPDTDPDDGQELLQAASLAGRIGLGRHAGRRTRRVVVVGGREVKLPARCAVCDGYNLHAGVFVGAWDREGLERLARYVSRPALSKSRLERRPDGLVVLHMKRTWSDGTAAKVFTPAEFVARLAALVPPPNKNMVLYCGVLAPNAALRGKVVPCAPVDADPRVLVKPERTARGGRRRRTWSELLRRVFGLEGWNCRTCGKPMTLRAVVFGPPASTRILIGLDGCARAPPIHAVVAPRA